MPRLQVFIYVSVHGAFRYGIIAPFRHPQPDPPPPQPQHHLQGMEDRDQLPQPVSPHVRGRLAASPSGNHIQRRRIGKPQQMATKMAVETLRTAERREHGDADAQLGDTEQSLSNESDSEELLQQPPAELPGASANANRARTEDHATNSDTPHLQTKQVLVNQKQLKEEAGKLKRAAKPPAEEQPSQTGLQVTFIQNRI